MRISDWSSDVCSSDLCAPPETVRVLVPRRWRLDPPGTFMRRDDIQPDATPLPDGYRLEQDTTDSIDTVRVLAADDSVVATGHVVVTDHTAIYDRVVTQEEHRRLGRSEEHTSEIQSIMRISYADFCL